jgi:hypothetical protein
MTPITCQRAPCAGNVDKRRNPITMYFINEDLWLCMVKLKDIRRTSIKRVLAVPLRTGFSEGPRQDQACTMDPAVL